MTATDYWRDNRHLEHGYPYEWPKPIWAEGYSKHGYYFSGRQRDRDKQTGDREDREYYLTWVMPGGGKHADFHWKMKNPPRGVTVD